jgi:hypothetical protein
MRPELCVKLDNPLYRPLAAASPPHLQGICELTRIDSVGSLFHHSGDAVARRLVTGSGRTNAVSKPVSTREVAET